MRIFLLFCIGISLFITKPLFAAEPFSYWDYFRIPQRDVINYEIKASAYGIQLLGDYKDYFKTGNGASLGLLKDKNDYRLGVDIGFISFNQKDNIDSNDEGYKSLTIAPLFFSFGINFKPLRFFNIIPFVAVGPTLRILEKEYKTSDGTSITDEDTSVYPIARVGLDCRFVFGPVFLQLGISFGALFEIDSKDNPVSPITIISGAVGVQF